MVILGRYSGDRDLQDRIMERLIAGDSPTDVIELIPEFGLWRHPTDHYAVFFSDDDGSPRAAGSLLARELDHVTERGAPWHRAAASGEEVTATLDDLPPGLRAARLARTGAGRARRRPGPPRAPTAPPPARPGARGAIGAYPNLQVPVH